MKIAACISLFLWTVPALAAFPPDYQLRQLENGLEVLVVEDHGLPLVTVEIGVRNGSMNESPEYNGLSHLYEHMFFKGNKVVPNQEAFLDRTRELGMVFNGTTETERVNYFFTTSADRLRPSLELMRDSIEYPLFDPEELRREKQVVVGEIDRNDADPFYHFSHAMDDLLWKYPSYKDPLGNRATVLAATPDMMRVIQRRYYVPNNALLVIAGDVSTPAAMALAAELFGAWPRSPDPFLEHPVLQEPPLQRSAVVVVQQPVQTVALSFQWEGPSAKGSELPATYAADVLSALVGQPTSRFQRDLVDSGACVRADLGWFTQAHVGPIGYGLEATPDRVDGCLRAAWGELARLTEPDTFSDEELVNARTQLEVRRALEREAVSSYAHVLSFFWSSTGLDYYQTYLDHIRGVNRGDLNGFLEHYVLGKPYVFGALVSPELAAKQALDEAHFSKLLAPAERLP